MPQSTTFARGFNINSAGLLQGFREANAVIVEHAAYEPPQARFPSANAVGRGDEHQSKTRVRER